MTDGPFASHNSNVLPAPAPMSINGRHVPKHIQHTKRTLWLEEMDCAEDWQGTLWMCQSLRALCFTPVPSFENKKKTFPLCFIRLCVRHKHMNFSVLHLAARGKRILFLFNPPLPRYKELKECNSVDLTHRGDLCPTGKRGIHSVLSSAQHAFVKALIYTFHDTLMASGG